MKISSFLVLFLIPVSLWSSSDQHENFVRANHAFATQDYVQACDAYKKIKSPAFIVNYNLAVSYVHQSQQAQAVLYARRAEKQANYWQLTKLYQFIDCLNRQVNPDYVISWQQQLAIFLKKCILSIPIVLLQIILLITCIAVILYWYNRWNLLHGRALLWIACFYLLLLSCWGYKIFYMQRQQGVVIKHEAVLRAGPDASFYKKSELHESDEVAVLGYRSGYYQIQQRNMLGWINEKDIEIV